MKPSSYEDIREKQMYDCPCDSSVLDDENDALHGAGGAEGYLCENPYDCHNYNQASELILWRGVAESN